MPLDGLELVYPLLMCVIFLKSAVLAQLDPLNKCKCMPLVESGSKSRPLFLVQLSELCLCPRAGRAWKRIGTPSCGALAVARF